MTEFVKPPPAVNILAVRTDNDWAYRERLSGARFQWADRNFNVNYGGIPKNVRLHITDRVYQTLPLYSHLGSTGVYVYAADFDIAGRSATIHAESEIRNDDTAPRTFAYRIAVADFEGKEDGLHQGAPLQVQLHGHALGGIAELVDQKNATMGEQNVGSGEFALIEVEFYEAARP